MSRPLRLDLPNCFYHVLNRGVDRRPVFEDQADHEKFLELLGLMSERYAVGIWSFVLVGNHYHLLIKPESTNLSKAMQWLGLSYSGYFNQRHRRSGPLFQGRFKSFIVEEGHYLKRLVCYIHRNPLRAGIVDRLVDYPWSSYPCLAYGRRCRPWLRSEGVLSLFGAEAERSRFREAVQSYSEEDGNLLEDLKHGILLGGERMAARLMEALAGETPPERPQLRKLLGTKPVEELVAGFAAIIGLTADEVEGLRRPIRRRQRPMRDLLIYLVWRNGHHTAEAVGEFFRVARTALPSARTRGAAYLAQNKKLKAKLKDRVTV